MKFLAVLRDSLREAIDTKIFYVMVALSALLTVLALSIGFSPRPAKDNLEYIANTSMNEQLGKDFDPENLVVVFMALSKAEAFEARDIEQLDETPHPADSRYRFVLTRKSANPLGGFGGSDVEKRLKDNLGRLGKLRMVEVEEVKRLSNAGGERYQVTVAPTSATRMIWLNDMSLFFGALPMETQSPLGFILWYIESGLVVGLGGWVALLVSVIITGAFIPNMLRKGTVEPLVVKPIHRWQLLIYKYIGGLTFIFLNTLIAIAGVWMALGLRSGVWATGLLWTIFTLTFFFAILYAVSTLLGVLTQSPVASILLTIGAWFFLFVVNLGYQIVEQQRVIEEKRAATESRVPVEEGGFPRAIRVVHYILPRTGDLNILNSHLLTSELLSANQLSGQDIQPIRVEWGETLAVSFAFIAIMLGLACWRFGVREL